MSHFLELKGLHEPKLAIKIQFILESLVHLAHSFQ